MTRIFFIVFLSISFSIGWSQNRLIIWEEGDQLQWSDFKSSPDSRSHHHALTASGISIDMQQTSEDSVSITVDANFYPQKSWLKKGKATDHLLNHEQRHFDISEIYRRKLIRTIMTSGVLESRNINNEIDKLYTDNDAALRIYQNKYDHETEHSQFTDKQLVWNKIIDDQLSELAPYNYRVVKFPLSLVLTKSSSSTTTTRKRKKRKRRN